MWIQLNRDIKMKRSGFTLIELVVVLAILSILISLGSKGLRSARIRAGKAQATTEMHSIEVAIKSYHNTYGKLPVIADKQGRADPEVDVAFSLEVIDILTAENSEDNPRKIVFLDPQTASTSSTNRAYLDPWGAPYQIALDTDYDGAFDYEGETIRRTSGVISIGLFEQTHASSDRLESWN
jgi:prepilin-type N-terminal cleavage/methylation domain-containing protein